MCVTVCGCSVTVLPKTDPAAVFKISEFKCQPVTVINAQSATGKIGSTGTGMGQIPKTVFGDLREWTEVASMFLRTELQKRTVRTAAQASKVLRLAVTKVEVTPSCSLAATDSRSASKWTQVTAFRKTLT